MEKNPKRLSVSLIYIADKKKPYKKSQAEVAKITKTNEVTIRSRIKDLKNCLINSDCGILSEFGFINN